MDGADQSRDVGGQDRSVPRCSRIPLTELSTRVEPICVYVHEYNVLVDGWNEARGDQEGGWERAGCAWVERPCPNTATPRVQLPEDSL